MNGNWSGPQGGSATGATITITDFRVWQLSAKKADGERAALVFST
jgi:hypothetical protein